MKPSDSRSSTAGDEGLGRAATAAVVIGVSAAVIAGATIWLLLTDPVTLATSLDGGEISPLVLQLADVLYNALISLLEML